MFEGELNIQGSTKLDPNADSNSRRQHRRATRTILIVDDHESLLTIIRDLLEKSGYQVVTASSGKAAEPFLASEVPDLIISDIMMPEIDGYQFFEWVKSDKRLAAVPFIFLTALGNCKEVRNGKALGCDDYLIKPFSPEDLLATVEGKLLQQERTLAISQSERESYQRRVINTLSHEFRTPLVAIHTGAELLLTNKDVEGLPRVRRLIEGIYRGGARLQKLVADFMLLQQIVSGSCDRYHRSTVQNCYIKRLVETSITQFIQSYEDCESLPLPTITAELDALADHKVSLSPSQFADILRRLLANAVKFGEGKTIQITGHWDGKQCVVQVRDHGPGLAEEKLREACDTFSQIDRDHLEQQGAGLGLTVCSYLIKLNGGSLKLENATDGGLIVSLCFASEPQSQSTED